MNDRYGEPLDNDPDTTSHHDPRCRRGWLGEDLDGHPIPCLICRPHLATTIRWGITR